jgi:DNA polymerase-3 subunit beta
MDIEIEVSHLAQATNRMQGALSETSLPYVSMLATSSSLQFSATDRSVAVFSATPCAVRESGEVAVPARLLCSIARQLPPGRIRLQKQRNSLQISSMEMELQMRIPLLEGLSWKEAPEIKEPQAICRISSSKLSFLLGQIQGCLSQDAQQNYAAVAYFHRRGTSGLRVVGTDGFRLSYCEVAVEMSPSFLQGAGVCLSKRGVSELLRMCHEVDGEIELILFESATKLLAKAGEYHLFCSLSAVEYPNYLGVLPKGLSSQVVLSKNDLLQSIKRILLVSDKSNAVVLSFARNQFTLQAKSADASEGKESVAIDFETEKETSLVINGKFLQDALSTLSDAQVVVSFQNEDTPIVLFEAEATGSSMYESKHLLVPIKESAA